MLDEHLNTAKNRRHSLVVRTQNNNPWMASRRVRTHVSKAPVKGDQHPTLHRRRLENRRIAASRESLLEHRIDAK